MHNFKSPLRSPVGTTIPSVSKISQTLTSTIVWQEKSSSIFYCVGFTYSMGFIVDNVVFIAAGFMCRTHGPPGCYPAGEIAESEAD